MNQTQRNRLACSIGSGPVNMPKAKPQTKVTPVMQKPFKCYSAVA